MFKALVVRDENGHYLSGVEERQLDQLPEGDLLIRVSFSSLNYKDALSASGNKGVTRHYPHTPGIDAAGIVEQSSSPNFKEGDEVIVTGYDLGMNTSGGLAEYIRVPANWVVNMPSGLSCKDAMVYGTAGFTAAMCVDTLLQVGISPSQGPVLVTGATGGVGAISVWLLSHLGFDVTASTG
ncbi:MAG: oxidoreductase, partial [Moraxellaceae bacterium]